MAVRPRRSGARGDGLQADADRFRAEPGSDLEGDSRSTSPRAPLASIWAVALASGLVALGLTEVIGALVAQRTVRVSLQVATIFGVSIVAGIACERTLMRVRSAIGDRHHQR
jgi:hypothetical protein